jgi:HK97 family phage portal protein
MTNKNIFRRAMDYVSSIVFPTGKVTEPVEKRSISLGPTNAFGLPYGFPSSPQSTTASLQLSAVYRCVEVISDAIASQTWDITEYKPDEGFVNNLFHKSAYLLNYEPNPSMSRYTMMKTLIAKVLLEGNGFLIIRRNGIGDPVRLDLVNGQVTMFKRPNGTIYYNVQYAGYDVISAQFSGGDTETVDATDMIHILNYSYDGIQGISTLTHAANSIGLACASESSAKGFFSSGANLSGILTVGSGLDDGITGGKLTADKAKEMKNAWAATFNVTSGSPGGVAVMEDGVKFTPVTVNMKDAQMLETRKFNVVEICRFFGVHPSKIFDNENLTYSNIESFQLGFLTDTVAPWDARIEAEFNRKLFRPSQRLYTKVRLNIDELISADMDTKANYYQKMYQVGAYTPNEIRVKVGQPKIKGGDDSYRPLNLIPVDQIAPKSVPVDKKLNTQ